jgi:hypothetical protein
VKLNYWFLTATIELCLTVVLALAGAMKSAALSAMIATVFLVIGMIREHQRGLR